MDSKTCETCGAIFSRPRDYSAPQWARRRFCKPGCVRGHLKPLGPKTRYRKVKVNGRTAQEHRIVVEQTLWRKLTREEHIHHANERKTDNAPTNLEITDAVSHGKRHYRGSKLEAINQARKAGKPLPMGRAIAKAVREALDTPSPRGATT